MRGVTVRDCDPNSGVLSFDLRDILSVLGEDAKRSTWTVRDVECLGGDAAAALHHASDMGERLTGGRLFDIARDVDQIIEGEFSARLPDDEVDWITIQAVDSSAFDVRTGREEILRKLRAKFSRVTDILR